MRIEDLLCSQIIIHMNKSQKPNLTNYERTQIFQFLSERSYNGKLPKGIAAHLGSQFNVTPRTINRIWKQGQSSIATGLPYANVESKIKFKSGRKKIYSRLFLQNDNFKLYNNIIIN